MKKPYACIIDSGTCNISSIISALKYLKINYQIIDKLKKINKFTHIILPGVGAFGQVSKALKKKKLDKIIFEAVQKKNKKIFGICLGMQLLFETSNEVKKNKGLCLIKGNISKFAKKAKSPHIGFNYVYHDNSKIWNGIPNPAPFYFVHSYRLKKLENKKINFSTTVHGERFVSFIQNKNIYGAQFHPEKSHKVGLKLLENFFK